MRLWHVPVHPDAIQMPLIIPIVYLILTGSLILVTIVMNTETGLIAGIVVLIGFFIYFLFFWEKTFQRFSAYRQFAHYINGKNKLL